MVLGYPLARVQSFTDFFSRCFKGCLGALSFFVPFFSLRTRSSILVADSLYFQPGVGSPRSLFKPRGLNLETLSSALSSCNDELLSPAFLRFYAPHTGTVSSYSPVGDPPLADVKEFPFDCLHIPCGGPLLFRFDTSTLLSRFSYLRPYS